MLSSIIKSINWINSHILNYQLARIKSLPGLYSDRLDFLLIDTSSSCNLACSTCVVKECFPRKKHTYIPDHIIEKITEGLDGINSVHLQCDCEPLLNKDIHNIIRKFKNKKPDIHISITTNGTLLNEIKAKQLIESGLDELSISIDGATKETFEGIRIKADFDDVIEKLKRLIELKKEFGSDTPSLSSITVASKENLNELDQIPLLLRELGISTWIINNLDPYREENYDKSLYHDAVTMKQQIRKLEKICAEHKITFHHPAPAPQAWRRCWLNYCTIDSDGNVYPCPLLSYDRPYYRKDEQGEFRAISFGNLEESSLKDIWESEPYRNFRRKLAAGRMIPNCHACLFRQGVICG